MIPSARCESLIKSFEQCRLKAYLPTGVDRPTLGWGCAAPDIHLGMTWTQEQADARFERDLNDFAASVEALIAGHVTAQNKFDALVSFAYNEGAHALATSTLLRKHNAHDYVGAAKEFARWDMQAGKVLNGLVRRRAVEAAMYSA